jgi:hypothetical protein
VPTQCRHRGRIIDPLGCKACRAIRQPISPSNQILDHSIQNHPKPVSFLSSSVSSESSLTPLNTTITHTQSYTVATSGVNRLASQICQNRLFHKKLQQNILPMISTEVSSLAAHNMKEISMGSGKLLELLRPLYGLADSGDYWGRTLSNHQRKDLGMESTTGDPAFVL